MTRKPDKEQREMILIKLTGPYTKLPWKIKEEQLLTSIRDTHPPILVGILFSLQDKIRSFSEQEELLWQARTILCNKFFVA